MMKMDKEKKEKAKQDKERKDREKKDKERKDMEKKVQVMKMDKMKKDKEKKVKMMKMDKEKKVQMMKSDNEKKAKQKREKEQKDRNDKMRDEAVPRNIQTILGEFEKDRLWEEMERRDQVRRISEKYDELKKGREIIQKEKNDKLTAAKEKIDKMKSDKALLDGKKKMTDADNGSENALLKRVREALERVRKESNKAAKDKIDKEKKEKEKIDQTQEQKKQVDASSFPRSLSMRSDKVSPLGALPTEAPYTPTVGAPVVLDVAGRPMSPTRSPEAEPADTQPLAFTYSDAARSAGESSPNNVFAFKLLRAHNYYRCMHGAMPLQWSDDLARAAQTWSEYVQGAPRASPPGHRKNLGGCGERGVGENIAKGVVPEVAVDVWYDEIMHTVDSRGIVHRFHRDTAHYSQLVWRDTKTLGCGSHEDLIVCWYGCAGNQPGEYASNVVKAQDSRYAVFCRSSATLFPK
eukprot:TRINITY_DN695_c0_g1_i2.p1 TRINITY_DN695_c0_g1~~TRINITY_DN695_c0_g1_i2.p1  ORF type:complete len:463 (-),score=109.35 TRINITY_DN695_c0_g1_i2:163-1551(-)